MTTCGDPFPLLARPTQLYVHWPKRSWDVANQSDLRDVKKTAAGFGTSHDRTYASVDGGGSAREWQICHTPVGQVVRVVETDDCVYD